MIKYETLERGDMTLERRLNQIGANNIISVTPQFWFHNDRDPPLRWHIVYFNAETSVHPDGTEVTIVRT